MGRDYSVNIRSALLWSNLAWFDIVSKYRRTFLGPFWITLSMGLSVGVLGAVYARILGQDLTIFIPYLAIGLVVWSFISAVIQEAPLVYPNSRHIILSIPVRIENIALRMVVRNFITMLHNAAILIPIAIFLGVDLRFSMLISFLGLFFIFVFCCSISVILGVAGARFRDVAPTVSALMGMLFLVTPIIWQPSQMQFIADINPLYHLVEGVRSPLMSNEINFYSLKVSGLITLSSALVAFVSLRRYRYKLVFWI